MDPYRLMDDSPFPGSPGVTDGYLPKGETAKLIAALKLAREALEAVYDWQEGDDCRDYYAGRAVFEDHVIPALYALKELDTPAVD